MSVTPFASLAARARQGGTVMAATRLTLEAVIVRADGTREDLGVIASNDPDLPGDVRVLDRDDEGDADE
jgi:hypothetical protein